ncbi:Nicotianamine synthase [Xylariales sp. PMI_506]|nr:Nicotianamine synthase [Xylariales sp. PMI_506]
MTFLPSSLCPIRRRADLKVKKSREFIKQVVDIHSVLVNLPDLHPGEIQDKTLGRLVGLCSQIHDAETTQLILSGLKERKILPSLRSMCSEAEGCLESYWAQHIADAKGPSEALIRLREFPYCGNYEDLARLELAALGAATREPLSRVCFIGSGPLPLTSLYVLQALRGDQARARAAEDGARPADTQAPIVVLNIDRDGAACSLSALVAERLGDWAEGMQFECADAVAAASATADLIGFQVVYLAALVGVTQREKEAIVLQLAKRMRRGALLVIRSAWGLRTILYPEVEIMTERLLEALDIVTVVHPYGEIVNSVIIARIK